MYVLDSEDRAVKRAISIGRQNNRWFEVLDGLEPEANASLNPKTLRMLGVEPGEMITVETRRGAIRIMARADRAISEDMIFVPFAYVEAAANTLTNPQLDPYGKIPEFKFSAVKVEKVEDQVAAE